MENAHTMSTLVCWARRWTLICLAALVFASAVEAQQPPSSSSASPAETNAAPRAVVVAGEAAVIAGNVANARAQAIRNALRLAVEQGLGLMLNAEAITLNFALLQDEILTASEGYVESYAILSEGAAGGSYRVQLRAQVSPKLKSKLASLRLLHQQMGNQRLLVVYAPEHPSALYAEHGANRSAMQAIRETFNSAGFRVFTASAAGDSSGNSAGDSSGNPAAAAQALARQQDAELLLRFEQLAGQDPASNGGLFDVARSTITLTVVESRSGRLLADRRADAKALGLKGMGPYDWDKKLAEAAQKAARAASEQAIQDVFAQYEQSGAIGRAVYLIFIDFDEDEKDRILDLIENLPGTRLSLERKNTPQTLEVEIFSNQEPSRLRRLVRVTLSDAGLRVQTRFFSQYRMVFGNLNPKRGASGSQ